MPLWRYFIFIVLFIVVNINLTFYSPSQLPNYFLAILYLVIVLLGSLMFLKKNTWSLKLAFWSALLLIVLSTQGILLSLHILLVVAPEIAFTYELDFRYGKSTIFLLSLHVFNRSQIHILLLKLTNYKKGSYTVLQVNFQSILFLMKFKLLTKKKNIYPTVKVCDGKYHVI